MILIQRSKLFKSMKTIKKILIIYKESVYKRCFQRNNNYFKKSSSLSKKYFDLTLDAHNDHYNTLKTILKILKEKNLNFELFKKSSKISNKNYDLVISVGGDGTFLYAAKNFPKSILLGCNSNIKYSVGKLCSTNVLNFENTIDKIIQKKYNIKKVYPLKFHLKSSKKYDFAINDMLITHENPATISKYEIKINNTKEVQLGSGIWISSAIGSTAGIFSAGGKKLDPAAKNLQFLARELYTKKNIKYKLRSEILKENDSINIISLMQNGMIYIDGRISEYKFDFFDEVKITLSKKPIKIII